MSITKPSYFFILIFGKLTQLNHNKTQLKQNLKSLARITILFKFVVSNSFLNKKHYGKTSLRYLGRLVLFCFLVYSFDC
jgi:hypothetical protein